MTIYKLEAGLERYAVQNKKNLFIEAARASKLTMVECTDIGLMKMQKGTWKGGGERRIFHGHEVAVDHIRMSDQFLVPTSAMGGFMLRGYST